MENVAKNSRKAAVTTTANRGAAWHVTCCGDDFRRFNIAYTSRCLVVSRGLPRLSLPANWHFTGSFFFGKVQRIKRQTLILLLYVYSFIFGFFFVCWPRRQQHNLPLALHQAQLSLARSQRRVAFPIPIRVSCWFFFLAISSRFRAFGVSYDLFDMTVKWTEIYFSMLRF